MVDAVTGLGTSGIAAFQQPQALTDDQKNQIQEILSKYDPNNLTADDAKSIFQAFQSDGIRPGPGMKDAITSAGFDSNQLRSLAMPSGHHHHPQSATAATTAGTAVQSGSGINVSALQQLQSILNTFDLNDLSQNQQQNLESQLSQSGLMTTGNTINIGA